MSVEEEIPTYESVDSIDESTLEESKAKHLVPIHEPVITEATASLKKVDNKSKPLLSTSEERAKITSETFETLSVSQVVTATNIEEIEEPIQQVKYARKTTVTMESTLEVSDAQTMELSEDKPKKKKKDKKRERIDLTVENVINEQQENLSQAVEETMDLMNAKEFGPGESPLRELATIGFLIDNGVSVNEINESLYESHYFPALRTPDAQNALVQLVEREGHGPLISQVLTEETTTDESIVAATVGFRAFMRMVELQHATVEEIITHFAPEDFRPRAWEVTEFHEVFMIV